MLMKKLQLHGNLQYLVEILSVAWATEITALVFIIRHIFWDEVSQQVAHS